MMIYVTIIFLSIASFLSFVTPAETKSLLPHTEIVIPIVNVSTTILAVFLLIFPQKKVLEYIILAVQCFFTTWTSYETLGTVLFLILLSFLFTNGFFKVHLKLKLSLLLIFWFTVLIGVFPFGLHRAILAYASAIFFASVSFYFYEILKDDLSTYLPVSNVTCSKLPASGAEIHLQDYGLTERQIDITKEVIHGNSSYKAMAEKLITSVSTVKWEMSNLFRIFEVNNREELRILLLQYKIK